MQAHAVCKRMICVSPGVGEGGEFFFISSPYFGTYFASLPFVVVVHLYPLPSQANGL